MTESHQPTVIEALQRAVADIPRYKSGLAPPSGAAGKLSSNELPYPPSHEVSAAVGRAAAGANRYPDVARVAAKLAQSVEVSPERVLMTNGSDEVSYLVAALTLRQSAVAVMGEPGYLVNEIATHLHGGVPVKVPLLDGRHDLGVMAERAQAASVVWVPNPHNPSGTAVEPDELEAFLETVPRSCLVVLDEAYGDFMDPSLRPPVNRLLDRHENLLIQRTFSKAYGLAGLRVGYAIADPRLIDALRVAKAPFSVNAAAIAAVDAVLDDDSSRTAITERIRRRRNDFERTLQLLGISYWPSQANFVTIFPEQPQQLTDAFTEVGVTVRDGAELGLKSALRVTIGTDAEMHEVVRALTDHASLTRPAAYGAAVSTARPIQARQG